MLLRLWSAAYDRKLTIITRLNVSCMTEAQREGIAQAFYPMALPSSRHSFYLTAHASCSLQPGGGRPGWRACTLQLRILPRSLSHHLCIHSHGPELSYMATTNCNGDHIILASFWAATCPAKDWCLSLASRRKRRAALCGQAAILSHGCFAFRMYLLCSPKLIHDLNCLMLLTHL